MATASTLGSQFGWAAEAAYGVFQVPTRFQPFTLNSLSVGQDRIEVPALRGRLMPYMRLAGKQQVKGNIEVPLAPQGQGLFLKHALGTVATTGAGPYVHTGYMHADWDSLSATLQTNYPDQTGTNRILSFLGCQIASWDLSCEVNSYAKWTFSFMGTTVDTTQSLATAAYPAGWTPFRFLDGVLLLGGAEYKVKRIQLNGNNNPTTDNWYMSGTTPSLPLQAKRSGWGSVTGNMVGRFEGLTQFNRVLATTQHALVLTFTSGANLLTLTTNVMLDDDSLNIQGAQVIDEPIRFTCMSATSDAAAFTAVMTNTDVAA